MLLQLQGRCFEGTRTPMDINPRLATFAVAPFGCAAPGFAARFSFTGAFNHDNDVQLFDFNLISDGLVTLQTLGYGGGTNVAGQTILSGGFEPILQIYTSGGSAVGGEINPGPGGGSCAPRVPDPNRNSFCQDAYAPGLFLNAGSYILALTQSPNTPNGNLSAGFFFDGGDIFRQVERFRTS
jgi:hypothetical protein